MDFTSPEWDDIRPLVQDDGNTPFVPINYDPIYKIAMEYCRALCSIPEYSKRALDVTTEVLTHNASHYSVWKYRLDIINNTNISLDEEWIFLNSLASENPKSFQIWHHRQALAERASNAKDEIDFVNHMIENDSKNYHAWSYRQWVVRTFELWEMEYVDLDRLIEEDVRNNSVWNQRFFVISKGPQTISNEVIMSEINYAISKIHLAPNNECPWIYIQGLFVLTGQSMTDFALFEEVAIQYANQNVRFAHVALLNQYQLKGLSYEYQKTCQKLQEIDPIRKKYWEFKAAIAL